MEWSYYGDICIIGVGIWWFQQLNNSFLVFNYCGIDVMGIVLFIGCYYGLYLILCLYYYGWMDYGCLYLLQDVLYVYSLYYSLMVYYSYICIIVEFIIYYIMVDKCIVLYYG